MDADRDIALTVAATEVRVELLEKGFDKHLASCEKAAESNAKELKRLSDKQTNLFWSVVVFGTLACGAQYGPMLLHWIKP